ncbi:MAG: NGG1p interacting factor NIF3 [Acidobacteria bacterium]|nr:MAG: NGG1p interacting factor NIF3 [Acidobacteriota bacterium]
MISWREDETISGMSMDRRTFVRVAGIGSFSVGAGTTVNIADQTGRGGPLEAGQINSHLRSLIAVDEPSVDRIVIGDPETVVTRIGTAWMPYWDTLRLAVGSGVNTLVVHEPAFYTHWDLDAKEPEFMSAPPAGQKAYLRLRDDKRKYIEDNRLVIIRCHDVLDRIPHFGIPFALGQALGFSETRIATSRRFYNVYHVEPAPALQVARRIADRLKAVRQPGVALYGDPKREVSTVGVGTGCICDPLEFTDLQPDLYIAIDDTVRTWIQTTYAEDTGHPLVVINHGTSEEFGMRQLNAHLRKGVPDPRSRSL